MTDQVIPFFCKQILICLLFVLFVMMYAEHEKELQILHANQFSESIFQLKSDFFFYTEIKDDYQTLKLYTPHLLAESHVHFMDIYSGQMTYVRPNLHVIISIFFRSFKVQIGAEHDGICKAPHSPYLETHHIIIEAEFEYFGSVGVALFHICNVGVYLSVANLNFKTRTVQVDFGNRVRVHAKRGSCRVQLLKIDDQTGVAIHEHNKLIRNAGGHILETFRLTDTGNLNIIQFPQNFAQAKFR